MDNLISVDIGHLLSEKGGPDFISHSEYDSLTGKHGDAFNNFQVSLREKTSPITLSLAEVDVIPRIKTLARELANKYENILVLGIGGSALGARAIMQFLRGPYYNMGDNRPRLFILDNLDPTLVMKLEQVIDISKTALVYVSKSGSTPETAAQFIYFYKKFREAGGDVKDIVICCDKADNGINRIAAKLGCHLQHIPGKLPGRYSVLSTVGFLPAELLGVDSAELLAGAREIHRYIVENPAEKNAVFALGACLFELAARGKTIHVLFNYSSLLYEFGLWFVQLWAESLGKRLDLDGKEVNAGTTPLTALGATDQHSILQLFKEGPADKVYGFVRVENMPGEIPLADQFPEEKEYAYFAGHTMGEQLHIEQLSTEMSLFRAGRPCYRVSLREISPAVLGALFYFYEALVVFSAALWNINPFDQPGVEEGKNITYALMGREGYRERRETYRQAVEQYESQRRVFGVGLKIV